MSPVKRYKPISLVLPKLVINKMARTPTDTHTHTHTHTYTQIHTHTHTHKHTHTDIIPSVDFTGSKIIRKKIKIHRRKFNKEEKSFVGESFK